MSDPTKNEKSSHPPNRRDVLLAGTALGATSALGPQASVKVAQAQVQQRAVPSGLPNIVLSTTSAMANSGAMALASCVGQSLAPIDTFAGEGMKLLKLRARSTVYAISFCFNDGSVCDPLR